MLTLLGATLQSSSIQSNISALEFTFIVCIVLLIILKIIFSFNNLVYKMAEKKSENILD